MKTKRPRQFQLDEETSNFLDALKLDLHVKNPDLRLTLSQLATLAVELLRVVTEECPRDLVTESSSPDDYQQNLIAWLGVQLQKAKEPGEPPTTA